MQAEAIEDIKKVTDDPEIIPAKLEEVAIELEGKVTAITKR